ncbi:MAG TPA: hypothetical protein VFL57_14010 [Bryobacteraceae bacterium]|nr:hypothetical protein [Bryobacteraceae bacterium]
MIFRWVARAAALLTFTVFAAFFVGSEFNYYGLNRTQTVLLITACVALAGMPLGWRSELLGGALNIAGVLAFYTVHFAARGTWPRGSFPLLAIPGLLFLISWWRSTGSRR